MTNNSAPPDRYGVVGHPIEHSRSPFIHTLFARQTGQHLTYELIDASPAAFETAVRGFGAAGGRGLNVTLPHKEAAFALVDELSHAARMAGAVNTITMDGNRLLGDNTDGVGFIRDITVNQGLDLADRSVMLFGAGGAARGIIGPLLAEKPAQLVIANRNRQRAVDLANHFGNPPELTLVEFEALAELPAFDLLVNASSAGLKGEATPFPGSLLRTDSVCYDMVYSRNDTPFVAWARQHGAGLAVQGWGMLVEQAAESFRIWRGVMPVTAPILKELQR
ncbi:MAG: shikimate dehydrogenase [Gammaproteobacteria bacterium]